MAGGNNLDGGLLGWAVAGIASVIATLSSAVAVLYRAIQQGHEERLNDLQIQVDRMRAKQCELEEANDQCIQDRARLTAECAHLQLQVDALKGSNRL